MRKYTDIVSVSHQGFVIAFAREDVPDTPDIYFNVLGLQVESESDSVDWTGFQKLSFTKQLRPAGMSIITLDETEDLPIDPADAPFRVVSDQKYISIIQQSNKGALYVNRFALLKTATGPDKETITYTLEPPWEVRYERSGKEDIPQDESDAQNYLSTEGSPFFEPTIELCMVNDITGGYFDVLHIPSQGSGGFNWQFIAHNKDTGAVDLYSFPADSSGLFDLTGKTLSEDNRILPDNSFTITDETGKQLNLQHAPRAAFYVRNEKALKPDGKSFSVKRSGRVLFSLPCSSGEKNIMGLIDVAVGSSGNIAQLSGPIQASPISPANYGLDFDGLAYVKLESIQAPGGNPLAIKGIYQIECWIQPRAPNEDQQTIIGGDQSVPEAQLAPFIHIKDGSRLELGFGNGTALVSCETQDHILKPQTWFHVVVKYNGAGDNPFEISINGSSVALTPCSTAAEPSGTPIEYVGAPSGGFMGMTDSMKIDVGGQAVCDLPFNDMDYDKVPPETENKASADVKAYVYGARLVPSSCPIDSNTTGTFYVDPQGLTIYAGIADFIESASSTDLLESADGLLHLYFQGTDGTFSVAQYFNEAARAAYFAKWAARDSDGNDQSGFMKFVGQRAGTFLNSSEITIAPSTASDTLCDLTIYEPAGSDKETWKGLPRSVEPFLSAFNGSATNDPDDPLLLNGKKVFFDYKGAYPAVVVETNKPHSGGYFLFLTRLKNKISLKNLVVSATGSEGLVDLKITMEPTKWKGDGTGAVITQNWKNVGADPMMLMGVLIGWNAEYDYREITSDETKVYGLTAMAPKSDEQVSYVSIYVNNQLKDFSLSVEDGDSSDFCTVHIKSFTLESVPRDQNGFAKILNGEDTSFPYPEGYKEQMAKYLLVLTDGLAAPVKNVSIESGDTADPIAFADLFRCIYTGDLFDDVRIAPTTEKEASVIQGATLEHQEDLIVLTGGSAIFGAVPDTRPASGAVALVSDTSGFTGGRAPLVQPGVNGGWVNESPRFCLDLNSSSTTNYVAYNVSKEFKSADVLSVSGDLTIEAWGRVNDDPDKGDNMRLMTYAVDGNTQYPDQRFRYMLGYKTGPCLGFGARTYIKRDYNFLPPDLTVQLYLKVDDIHQEGTVLSLNPIQSSELFLRIFLDKNGYPNADFMDGAGTLRGGGRLSEDKWTCLTCTVAKTGDSEVTISLFMDDGDPKTTTAKYDFQGRLGQLMIGSNQPQDLAFKANGVALWTRVLSVQEVKDSFNYSYLYNDPGLAIRWNLTDGNGKDIINSAASGPDYNTEVVNPQDPAWDQNGVFKTPYVGRNDMIYTGGGISRNWTHVAYVYRQGKCINLADHAYAECQSPQGLNLEAPFTIEAWIKPEELSGDKQVVLAREGSYEIRIDSRGAVRFVTNTKIGDETREINVTSSALEAGKPYYIVCQFETGAEEQEPSQQYQVPKFYIKATLYVNGEKKEERIDDLEKEVRVDETTNPLLLGKSVTDDFYYSGQITKVRFWSRLLAADEIKSVYLNHTIPDNRDSLVSAWDFSEMDGKVVYDGEGDNKLLLTSNELWGFFEEVAEVGYYVNGKGIKGQKVDPTDVGGYGDQQFNVGALISNSSPSLKYVGQLDEFRIWDKMLTQEQINDSMNRTLFGDEEGLAGYWRFDMGSGTEAVDRTGRGNNGTFKPDNVNTGPQWAPSTAPIGNEAYPVYNVLNGLRTRYSEAISGPPSIIEYADTQEDAYGKIFSVLKRAYLYNRKGTERTDILTGYKVGDLDTIYLGQVQTKPNVVGFIEGGPPIPSENQTIAYWSAGRVGSSNPFSSASSVEMDEAESKAWSFSGDESITGKISVSGKGGLIAKGKFGTSAGVGAEVEVEVGEYKVKGGLTAELEGVFGSSEGVASKHGSDVKVSNSLAPAGSWEDADNILNPQVGRRYVQDNTGIAVVKSRVADLYMVALKGSNTAVKYTVVPNLDIPEDVNIIDFPINPKYVKNGTLDGKVGLVNDPDYPNADQERGSYFKPVEAYKLKQEIEKQEKQLEAYYSQFSTLSLSIIFSLGRVKDILADNPAYDWAANFTKRSIVNTYVWSAGGGLHKEQHSTTDFYSESYSGVSSLGIAGGIHVEGEATTPAGGVYGELDVLAGVTFQMSAQKGKESSVSFGLSCSADPTGFLNAPIIEKDPDGKITFKGYTDNPAPGKVDTYRYMAFYLAPSDSNFQELKKVIDPNWLQNSSHANAGALREAVSTDNGTWRIMYRTTFVSRVPAEFQSVNNETQEPNITPPANLSCNTWIVRIIEKQVSKKDPTPEEIGKAVYTVLGKGPESPGMLADIVPWWKEFLTAASKFGSREYQEMVELQEDLLQYMIQKYEADSYQE